jgi:hypothetical protein
MVRNTTNGQYFKKSDKLLLMQTITFLQVPTCIKKIS